MNLVTKGMQDQKPVRAPLYYLSLILTKSLHNKYVPAYESDLIFIHGFGMLILRASARMYFHCEDIDSAMYAVCF